LLVKPSEGKSGEKKKEPRTPPVRGSKREERVGKQTKPKGVTKEFLQQNITF